MRTFDLMDMSTDTCWVGKCDHGPCCVGHCQPCRAVRLDRYDAQMAELDRGLREQAARYRADAVTEPRHPLGVSPGFCV